MKIEFDLPDHELQERIVEVAASRIKDEAIEEATWSIAERIGRVRDEAIEAKIKPEVTKAFEEMVELKPHTTVNGSGDIEVVNLRTLINRQVQAFLHEKVPNPERHSSYGDPRKARIEWFIEKEVNSALEYELKKAVDEGKEQVKVALREKGAELLAKMMQEVRV